MRLRLETIEETLVQGRDGRRTIVETEIDGQCTEAVEFLAGALVAIGFLPVTVREAMITWVEEQPTE